MADYANQSTRPARGPGGRPYSGTAAGGDPTNEPGQYPPGEDHGIFGGPLPTGTGAPGTSGAGGSADVTNQPGQTEDGLTGITESEITQTGAPGTQGARNADGGADAVTFTRPSDGIGTYEMVTDSDDIAGPRGWTQANDQGYATGGPQLPGLKGNEPEAGGDRFQPGGGRVMRGGRMRGGS